jgi:hypothetical protein
VAPPRHVDPHRAELALVVTVVGIPLAVLLLGRWAVAVQVCAVEGLSPRQALRRSRELTAGRLVVDRAPRGFLNVLGAASGPVVGIVLLFASDLPLETVNAVSSAVFVAVMPFVGASMAFLYGSLVARSAEPREESPRPASRVWWPLAWARRTGAPGGGT